MQAIRDFITTRNHKTDGDFRICIPMSDVIHGQVDEGALVIVFTKFDLIVPNISSSQNDYEERCLSLFGNVPAEIVSTQPKFRHLINKLVATTDGVIIAHSRNISSPSEEQRLQPRLSLASRGINIQAAIECITSLLLMKLLSHDVRQSRHRILAWSLVR
ncbi:hypothetical protein BGY98DRAFT_983344 [Russula aff. rugulosa BPL654]|nr:hypothetical protein BGY98DRAFT_983344 [Russula aff. rugulosa BPL654]